MSNFSLKIVFAIGVSLFFTAAQAYDSEVYDVTVHMKVYNSTVHKGFDYNLYHGTKNYAMSEDRNSTKAKTHQQNGDFQFTAFSTTDPDLRRENGCLVGFNYDIGYNNQPNITIVPQAGRDEFCKTFDVKMTFDNSNCSTIPHTGGNRNQPGSATVKCNIRVIANVVNI